MQARHWDRWQRCRLARPAVCAALVSLACAVLAAPVRADQEADDYDRATGYYKKSRWQFAAEAYEKFTRAYPRSPRLPYAMLYQGISLENLEKYSEARRVLRGFVARYTRNRNHADAMFRVGECSYFLDDLNAAERELSAFLRRSSKHEFAEYALPYLGDAQLRLKKSSAAALTFKKSLDQFPRGRMALQSKFGLARCYEALSRPADAIKLYRSLAAEKQFGQASRARFNLATLLFEQKLFIQAAKEYARFASEFRSSPLVPQAHLNGGFALYRSGRYESAIAQFASAGKYAGQRDTADYWKAMCLKSLRRYSSAADALAQQHKRTVKGSLGRDVLFQLANCRRLARDYKQATALFDNYVSRWPRDKSADDALHYAAESALLAGDLPTARRLIDRFDRDYPTSDLRLYQRLLKGRVAAARGGADNQRAAAAHFRSVLAETRLAHTRQLARLHLGEVLVSLRDHPAALKTLGPLLTVARQNDPPAVAASALPLAAAAHLELDGYKKSAEFATLYLKLHPTGEQAAAALSTRALAFGRAADKAAANADIAALKKSHAATTFYAQTVHLLAEWAYGKKDWKWSGELFARLAAQGRESPLRAAGVSGLGWSRFQLKDYRSAAAAFAQLVREHADDAVLAPQAGYKHAESLEKLNDRENAVRTYAATFAQFAPQTAARPGSEIQGQSHYYTFHAGLSAARLYGKLKQRKQADAAYSALLSRFPKPRHLDRRLDEWALLHYNAGDYQRADEIFRRLVNETPDSELADNARYTLAESDLNAGRLDAAKRVFAKLTASSASDALVQQISLYRLMGIAVEQSDWKQAESRSAEFLKRFSTSQHRWYASFVQVESRIRRGETARSVADLNQLKKQTPDAIAKQAAWFPRVWVLLAETHFRRKEYARVAATVEQLRRLYPKTPLLYQADDVLGRSYKQQAKLTEARAAFKRVVSHPSARRTETAAKCQFLIGETYLLQEDYKQAQKEYLAVYSLYEIRDWQAPALFMAGRCDEQLMQWKQAVKTYEDLIREFPKSEYAGKARTRLAVARKRAGR